ncbi:MAG: aminoacylase [Bacteroides sp. SM23_62]|nr:MAG: aminoacylase [Bacteroides sp. SM23_62]
MKYLTGIILLFLLACTPRPAFDIVLRNGTVYDGSGSPSFVGDIAINADTILAIGNLESAHGKIELDVDGMAVAPGFINMLSWAQESLIEDGRSQSNIRQGVTLEVMGEGWSMGPLTPSMKKENTEQQGDIKFDIEWTTLGEFLEYLEKKGVSCNIASFVGATTIRVNALGYEDRPPTPAELDKMKELVREAMEEGAVGISSSLIYAPAFFADTEELIELCRVVSSYNGLYITHMRSEGEKLLEGIDEVIRIAEEAGIPAEIYHLKAAGTNNWYKMNGAIAKIDSARQAGLHITADMYNYTAAGTGLYATMPQWVQEGGHDAWVARLKDPEIRERVIRDMRQPGKDWENFFYMSGSPENIMLVGFKQDSLKYLTGKTLAQVAEIRHTSPAETIIELVVQDNSRVDAIYFLMSEENIRKQIALPWVSFGSDEQSLAPEGVFLKSNPHPRAYGNFSRLLGKYVRDENIFPLQEAIRKLTHLPAENLKIKKRGLLKEGYYADIVVFDPEKIQDHATFENPHQYATGVMHVFVNGQQVLKDGEHTGTTPGRIIRGPGYKTAASQD